jgi:hypothetical protein
MSSATYSTLTGASGLIGRSNAPLMPEREMSRTRMPPKRV